MNIGDRVYSPLEALRPLGAGTVTELINDTHVIVQFDNSSPRKISWAHVRLLPNRDYTLSDHDRRIIALGMVDCEGNPIDELWVRIASMSSLQMVAEGIVTVEAVER